MRISRQEYGSGLPCPPPGDLSNPGLKPVSLKSPALAGGFFTISATSLLRPILCAPRTGACQVSPSMGFSRQEYWSGLPFPSPGHFPNSGIEPASLVSLHCKQIPYPLSHWRRHLGRLQPKDLTCCNEDRRSCMQPSQINKLIKKRNHSILGILS